jgi:hypothetical protein
MTTLHMSSLRLADRRERNKKVQNVGTGRRSGDGVEKRYADPWKMGGGRKRTRPGQEQKGWWSVLGAYAGCERKRDASKRREEKNNSRHMALLWPEQIGGVVEPLSTPLVRMCVVYAVCFLVSQNNIP